MDVNGLANTEMFARILDVGFAHFRDGEESTETSIELNDSALWKDIDERANGLGAGGSIVIRSDDGEIGVDKSFFES